MTHPPNSYCRVTFYVASVQSLELASSAEPQRLTLHGPGAQNFLHNPCEADPQPM